MIILSAVNGCCDHDRRSAQVSPTPRSHVLPVDDAMNSTNALSPTSATQAKERLYSQLASSIGRMSRAISHTADLCEQLQVDLQAMRTFAGLDAAK